MNFSPNFIKPDLLRKIIQVILKTSMFPAISCIFKFHNRDECTLTIFSTVFAGLL